MNVNETRINVWLECFMPHPVHVRSTVRKQRNQLRRSNDVNDRIACSLTRLGRVLIGDSRVKWHRNAHTATYSLPTEF